jgi:hypothetical protein
MKDRTVPATTSVRASRVRFIDADRLQRRRAVLVAMADDGFREIGRRSEFVRRAIELRAIEIELVSRGQLAANERRTIG